MSAEDAPHQPPAPKPAAATFSSFINKNTTGKKFAPKAARRRPAAAAPTPTPTPSAPETPATEPPPTVQAPTPAATQASSTVEPSTAPAQPTPTPAPTNTESQAPAEEESHVPVQPSTDQGLTTQYLEDAGHGGRSPKRRRIEPPVQLGTPASQEIAASAGDATEPSLPVQRETAQPEVAATVAVEPDAAADAQALPQPRKRRKLPWAAVNHDSEGEEETGAAAPTKKPRQPRKKKAAAVDPDADHVDEEEEDEAEPTRKRPTAKPRARKKATVPTTENGEEGPAPPKKAKKSRKSKAALSNEVVEGTEDEVGRIADEIVAAAVRRKPKAKRRRKATPDGDEVDGIEGEEGTVREKKRKGRPPREPTPSDAEDQTIDPDVTYMDSLAARDLRVGKLSAREKQMRTIDWEAVKQRRREEDNKNIPSKADQEKADRALAEAGAELAVSQVEQGPRFRMNAEGDLEIDHDTGVIDREGDADRLIREMVTIEDQDITAHLTTRSFMKNNKRFPNEFLLPGQGRRWTQDLTELFYESLKSFGTDFQMISQMFPGFTRRSIKTKFTREERENPERIRALLQGQCEINQGGWNTFLEKSQKTEASFADADAIKREMAEEEAEYKDKIAAAQAEAQERKRQREIAGIDEDGNPVGEGAGKEGGKGKKKRGKNKQVAFQEEQGVEIVGEVGDDDTWGQE